MKRRFFRPARRSALLALSAAALVPALCLPAALLAARPALAARLQDAKEYVLQRVYKSGDTDRYRMTVNAKTASPQAGGDIELAITMVMKETTKEVKPDGVGVILIDFEQAIAKFGDFEQDASSFLPKITQSRDSKGNVLSSKLEGGNVPGDVGGDNYIQQLFALVQKGFYPERAVKIGDTWQIVGGAPDSKEQAKVRFKGTGTLVGMETVKGKETYKIKTVLDGESGGEKDKSKVHIEAVGNLSTADGKFVQLNGTVEGSAGTISKGDIKMALLDPNEKPADDKKAAAK